MQMRSLRVGASVLAIMAATVSVAGAQTTTSNSSNLGTVSGGVAAPAFNLNSANTVFTNSGAVYASGTAVTTSTGAASTTSIVNTGTLSTPTSAATVITTSTTGGVVHFATSGALINSGSIIASGSAVTTVSGTTVAITNASGGVIRGSSAQGGTDAAVYFGGSGSLSNAGTIQASGTAVSVQGTGNVAIANTGTISSATNGSATNAILVNTTGTFTLSQSSGTITNTGAGATIDVASNTASGSSIALSGGVISNTGTGAAINTAAGSSLAISISGGTITAAAPTAATVVLGGAGVRLSMSGGTISATDGIAILNTGGTVSISGGSVTAAGTNKAGISGAGGTINVAGGTVTGTGTAGAINFASGTNVLNWSGGTLTNGITSGGGTNTVNITGAVTATGTQWGGSYTTSISSAGTLTLANGATFSPAGAGITNAGTVALTGAAATFGTTGQTITNTGTISVGSGSVLTVAGTLSGANGTLAISVASPTTAGTTFGQVNFNNVTTNASAMGTIRVVLPTNNPAAAVGTYTNIVTNANAGTGTPTVTSSVSGYSVTATALAGGNISITVGAFNVSAVTTTGGSISTTQQSTVTSLLGTGAVQNSTADSIRSAVVSNGSINTPLLETVAPSTARSAESSTSTATNVVNVVATPVQTRLAAIRLGDATNMASAGESAAGMATSGDAARGRYVWIQALGGTGDQDARANSLGYKSDFYGSAVGADMRVGTAAIVGASFAYGRATTDQKGLATTGNRTKSDTYTGMLYGSYSFGAPFVEGNLGYARMNFTADRNVAGAGASRGEYDGNVFFGRAAVGYLLPLASNFSFTPSLGADAVRITTESYTESTGARGTFGSTSGNVFRVGPSARLNHSYAYSSDMRLLSELRAGYTYRLNNTAIDQAVSPFQGATTYTAPGVKPARGETTVGGSLSLANSKDLSVGAGYDLTLRDQYVGHTFTGRVRLPF
ncbi:MAG: autotransporter domain-containing protein [Alphaproteobacteria bacterium]|nr:autotransporter domain-containing protein [Alphaproteobacteria bacterium]